MGFIDNQGQTKLSLRYSAKFSYSVHVTIVISLHHTFFFNSFVYSLTRTTRISQNSKVFVEIGENLNESDKIKVVIEITICLGQLIKQERL